MSASAFLDTQIIAEIENDLRRIADEAMVHAANWDQRGDDVQAEYCRQIARRYRQLADAVERHIFGWLDHDDVDPDLIRRPLTPADVLAAMTPGQALIAMSNAHFALPGGGQ